VFTLWLEPWGEDYTLLPDETVEVVAKDAKKSFYFHVVNIVEGVQVYAEGTCGSVSVFHNGKLLERGYNREVRS
jgi:hypothetical protein